VTETDGHALPLDANLSRSRDRQIGVRLPIAVDEKLDWLLALAVEAGERTNRKELLAALVASCKFDGDSIGELLRTYRRMKVRDLLPPQPKGTKVVHLADHRPGPRLPGNGR
jgi:hypothetical protein